MQDLISIQKGTLLIASPEIQDDFFSKSVVLICEHTSAGSFGLVINKPLETDLPDELFDPLSVQNSSLRILLSGPNQTNQLMLLHSSKEEQSALEICQDVFLGGDLDFLQSQAENISGSPILLCFGYTGWGPYELERDIHSKLWFTHKAQKEHLFQTPPHDLWKTLLKQKGGKYASLANIPEDLSLN